MGKDWPAWWSWEVDLGNPHLIKRMRDRGFDEIDLRQFCMVGIAHRRGSRWAMPTLKDLSQAMSRRTKHSMNRRFPATMGGVGDVDIVHLQIWKAYA